MKNYECAAVFLGVDVLKNKNGSGGRRISLCFIPMLACCCSCQQMNGQHSSTVVGGKSRIRYFSFDLSCLASTEERVGTGRIVVLGCLHSTFSVLLTWDSVVTLVGLIGGKHLLDVNLRFLRDVALHSMDPCIIRCECQPQIPTV
jgi:hypothetical protein